MRFPLQDGFDISAADHLLGSEVAMISNLRDLWYNYSYDDPTDVASTVFYGDDRFSAQVRPMTASQMRICLPGHQREPLE